MNLRPRRRRPKQPATPPVGLTDETCRRCHQRLDLADACTPSPYPTSPAWGEEAYWLDHPHLEPRDHCPWCWASRGTHHHHDCLRAWCDPCNQPLYNCPHGQGDPH